MKSIQIAFAGGCLSTRFPQNISLTQTTLDVEVEGTKEDDFASVSLSYDRLCFIREIEYDDDGNSRDHLIWAVDGWVEGGDP